MTYASVCSGIEAATVAWHELGWEPMWFSEIAPFPCKLLKYRYPNVPNLGDMIKLSENDLYNKTVIDLLVGGTPCQSFSVAGLREGLHSTNGNLSLEYCRILIAKRPPWFLWENVPGVFSSFSDEEGGTPDLLSGIEPGDEYCRDITETADFATLLTAFRECGYSVAWRVLDSQHFGVPQRRRRVFVVGYLGDDWRPPAAVLFESESLCRDFTPSREKGGESSGNAGSSPKSTSWPASVAATLTSSMATKLGQDNQHVFQGASWFVPCGIDVSQRPDKISLNSDLATPITKGGTSPGYAPCVIVHGTQDPCVSNNTAFALGRNNGQENVLLSRFTLHGSDGTTTTASETEVCSVLRSRTPGHIVNANTTILSDGYIVRRLTPLECERLQGFPDNYTNIPGASDTARYAAIGNSMTTHVMKWIGERIELVDNLIKNI